ncbi:class E sortase [Actinomadura flavalba]|uniref:class E sortase n=1 Tax=Actinomadura flavalba TaxID=1120938 RepID=UPI00039BEE0D|nr:class E sortase [Actinomadura flavalba]
MRVIIRGLGELCITAGVVVLLFVTYSLWGTGRYTQAQQDKLDDELSRAWREPRVTTEKVSLGKGMARIHVPRFGKKFSYVIVEGVEPADLRKGPGHYPGSALPGAVGNFVVSAHRTTYSAPFNRVGELKDGDEIVIDTRTRKYTYQVTGRRIVNPSAVEVTSPVPGRPGRKPKQRMITLTTCHPKYSAAQRLVIFGKLSAEVPRVPATAQR